MNYLLYGTENFLLEKEEQKILAKEGIEEVSISRYDYTVDSLSTILEDARTISFFTEKKAVIVENANFFNRGKGTEEECKKILSYLKEPNQSTICIFINHNESVDNTKSITKTIKQLGVLKELATTNLLSEIEKMFQGYKIEKSTIRLFQERVGEDLTILEEEANKLKLYCYEELTITDDDVLKLTSLTIDTDIYRFMDFIIQKEKTKAMTMYYEIIKNGEKPVEMLPRLASKIRLMYQSCELTRQGYSQQDISTTLGAHSYAVKLSIQAGLKYPAKVLLTYLNRLADLDIQIKTGKIDPVLGFELFLLDV